MTFTPTSHSRNNIVKEILIHRGMTIKDVTFRTRSAKIVAARREIAYWLRMRTGMSLFQIAEVIGLKDHATVLHNIHKHAALNELEFPPSGDRLSSKFDPNVAVPAASIMKKIYKPSNSKPRAWTEKEENILKSMLADQRSDKEIAMVLGRSFLSIQGKASQLRKYGAEKRLPGGRVQFWTDEKKQQLVELYKSRMLIEDIAKELGCTFNAVKTKLYYMNITTVHDPDRVPLRRRPRTVKDRPDPIERGIHPMWNMPEDERRIAIIEKEAKGCAEVLKRLNADKQAA